MNTLALTAVSVGLAWMFFRVIRWLDDRDMIRFEVDRTDRILADLSDLDLDLDELLRLVDAAEELGVDVDELLEIEKLNRLYTGS